MLLLYLCGTLSAQQERIILFKSDITVNTDASLLVRETISVKSTGETIKHGIVREFPTHYKNYHGTHYVVDFDLHEILQDNRPTEYSIHNASNGKKIYIGDKNRLIDPGVHTYTLIYSTQRQLGFFVDHDELYWNVTGNGWRLPIDAVEAVVHLPPDIEQQQIHVEAHTGVQDSTGVDCDASINDHEVIFVTTRPLRTYEGLTIAVEWPKGFVTEPSWIQKIRWFMRDNGLIAVAISALLLFFVWYLFCWLRVRRKNRPGVVIPLFYPPHGMSPSAMGFMQTMKCSDSLLSPDIIHLAVKGFIKISSKKGSLTFFPFATSSYTLTCSKDLQVLQQDTRLSTYEIKLLSTLFAQNPVLTVNEKNSRIIKNALAIVKKQCTQYGHFIERSIIALLIGSSIAVMGGISLVMLMPPAVIFVFLLVSISISFLSFLKSYTLEGRKLQDAMDGFKLYLTTAETERLKIIGTPPIKTPTLYETYLPYAMALGVEEQWTHQFTPIFAALEREGHPYTPLWYVGRPWRGESFASSMHNSFNNAISSASTPPGKSSGLGGRGRSGGGG
jgi:hypothetical protein